MVTLLLMTSFAFATDDVQTAKVLAVKAHENGRIAYWEGRVAIYDGYPFYDITLSLGQKKYVVRCESLTGFYPSSWKVGREIQVRMLGKGKLYLINGAEVVEKLMGPPYTDSAMGRAVPVRRSVCTSKG